MYDFVYRTVFFKKKEEVDFHRFGWFVCCFIVDVVKLVVIVTGYRINFCAEMSLRYFLFSILNIQLLIRCFFLIFYYYFKYSIWSSFIPKVKTINRTPLYNFSYLTNFKAFLDWKNQHRIINFLHFMFLISLSDIHLLFSNFKDLFLKQSTIKYFLKSKIIKFKYSND